MDRNEVYTVKIYFIKPVDLISVIINTLIEMEYETYTIEEYDKEKLLKILPENKRNVIFLSIAHKQEIPHWLEYIGKVSQIKGTMVQTGAFVYSQMDINARQQFLLNNVSVTSFGELTNDTVKVLQWILMIFEARGKRRHIRVKARGIRIRTAGKLLGFGRDNKNIFVFSYSRYTIDNNKMSFSDRISREVKQKLYSFIKACLREDLTKKLARIHEPQ